MNHRAEETAPSEPVGFESQIFLPLALPRTFPRDVRGAKTDCTVFSQNKNDRPASLENNSLSRPDARGRGSPQPCPLLPTLGPEWGLPASALAGVSGTLRDPQQAEHEPARIPGICHLPPCPPPPASPGHPQGRLTRRTPLPLWPSLNLPPHTAGKFQSLQHTPSHRHKLQRSHCPENKVQPPTQPGGPARRAGLLNRAGSVPTPGLCTCWSHHVEGKTLSLQVCSSPKSQIPMNVNFFGNRLFAGAMQLGGGPEGGPSSKD